MAVRNSEDRLRIRDIAEAAEVSIATASNVLSGRKQVDSELGQRVLEIARRMGYQRRSGASLKRVIRFVMYKKHGMVIMDTPFFSELIAGVEQACRRERYELIISYVTVSDGEAEARLKPVLADESSAILLLATEMDEDDLRLFERARVPVLVLDSLFWGASHNAVLIDNFQAGALAGRYLARMGHRRIGFLSSSLPFNNNRDRGLGLESALREAGIALDAADIYPLEPTMDGAHRDMRRLLSERGRPDATAFFAVNDIIAVGAARAMKECGIRLPDEISIIGMDDMPICQVVNPPLTTISVSKAAIGEAAVARLIRMIAHSDGMPEKTLIGVSLVERESVARVG